jgi:hypothetical protein
VQRLPVIALCAFALSTSARAEDDLDCRPAVRIEGLADDTALIAEDLRARGIETQPAWRCMAMRVRVRRGGGEWTVDVAHDGELLSRSFVDPAAAGAFIASWLSAEPGPAPQPLRDAPGVNAAERWPRASAGAFDIDATFDGVGAEDTGYGLGLTVSGCAPAGRFCVGALGHFAKMMTGTDINESTGFLGEDIWSADLLFFGEIPVRSTHWQLSPYLGAGLGYLHNTSTSGLGPRLEGGFSTSLSISTHVAFLCRISALWSPAASNTEQPLVGRLGLGIHWSGP